MREEDRPNVKATLPYLEEFLNLANHVSSNKSLLVQMIEQSVELFIKGSDEYRFKELYQRESKKRATFNYASIMYLLERRRVVLS